MCWLFCCFTWFLRILIRENVGFSDGEDWVTVPLVCRESSLVTVWICITSAVPEAAAAAGVWLARASAVPGGPAQPLLPASLPAAHPHPCSLSGVCTASASPALHTLRSVWHGVHWAWGKRNATVNHAGLLLSNSCLHQEMQWFCCCFWPARQLIRSSHLQSLVSRERHSLGGVWVWCFQFRNH